MITEPLASFLTDFGLTATVGGVSVRGIFDPSYVDAVGYVAAERASLLCSPGVVAAVGTSVVIEGGSYTVSERQNNPPGYPGMTLLVLKS